MDVVVFVFVVGVVYDIVTVSVWLNLCRFLLLYNFFIFSLDNRL